MAKIYHLIRFFKICRVQKLNCLIRSLHLKVSDWERKSWLRGESKRVIIVTNDVQKNNGINNVQINKNTKL